MARIYAGSAGIRVELDTKVDMSLATEHSIWVKFPDGTTAEWIAAVDVVRNTVIVYTTQEGDLAQAGKYYLQAHFLLGGVHGWGDPFVYTIYPLYQV